MLYLLNIPKRVETTRIYNMTEIYFSEETAARQLKGKVVVLTGMCSSREFHLTCCIIIPTYCVLLKYT